MYYNIPYGINIMKRENRKTIGKLPDEIYLAEIVKIVASTMKTGGFLGLGADEKVDSIGKVYLSFFIASYENRNLGLVIADDILCRKRSFSIPYIFPNKCDEICRTIESASTSDGYINRLQSTTELVNKVQKVKHEVYYPFIKKKLVNELDNFLIPLEENEEINYVVTDSQTSKIDTDINKVLQLFNEEDSKLNELPSKMDTIENTIVEETNDWIEKLENERREKDDEFVDKINTMVDNFNNNVLPRIQQTMEQRISSLEMQKNNFEMQYQSAKEKEKAFRRDQSETGKAMMRTSSSEASRYQHEVRNIDSQIRDVKKRFEAEENAERSKMEAVRKEKEKMNEYYQSKENKIMKLTQTFQNKSHTYISNIKNELNNTINEMCIQLNTLKNKLDVSNKAQIFIPVYLANLLNKKKGTNRLVVIPTMKMEEGKLKVQKDSMGAKILGKITKTVGAESLNILIKENMEKKLKEDKNFQKLCLSNIRNNSILTPSSEDFNKTKISIQKMKKNGKIKDKEFNKIQTILKG